MNQKELNEIRRRIRLDRSSIGRIYGCYVNANKEIISYIDESLGIMSETETEQYLALLRKSLSGALGKNLMDISFATKQVMDSDEHRLLSALRKSELQDPDLRETFFKCIIDSLNMEDTNYLILIAFDSYDVPHYGKDGMEHDSDNVYKYILCSVCPIKAGKAELGFDSEEKRFHSAVISQIVSKPELGFLFPTFDDRSANIYNALFYSHNTSEIHQEFIDAVFKTEVPMSAGHQKDAFNSVLTESLDKDCSYDVIQSVHEQLSDRIEAHKESKDPEPLTMSVDELTDVLENSGMKEEHVETFKKRCVEEFGENAMLPPANLIDAKKIKIDTPEVSIKVDPKFSYLVQTRIIEGRKYILIAAESGVEVNGIGVNIEE